MCTMDLLEKKETLPIYIFFSFKLTVDVQVPRVLDLARRHDGVLGPAAEQLPQVGQLGLEAEGALGHVATVTGLRIKE